MKKFVKLDFSIQEIDKKNNYGKFQIEPLVQGFGITLGNSLRRVLLSSLLGSSIYAYQIEGVEQEFQNLPGCLENVTQVSLNVKKIIVSVDETIFTNEDEKIKLQLKAEGTKAVLAKDIKLPAGIRIINGDQEILNIVKKGQVINMNFFVIQGRGFSNFQDNKELTANKIGLITVSSNFSIVKKVSFKVKEINIGHQNVSESLVLEIETNSIVSPSVCLVKASQILISHLECFLQLTDKDLSSFVFKPNDDNLNNIPNVEIINLDFSERTTNALRSENINYLNDLSTKKKRELLEIKNLGQKSLKEIVDKLQEEFKIKLKE